MPISGSRRSLVGIRPVRWLLFQLSVKGGSRHPPLFTSNRLSSPGTGVAEYDLDGEDRLSPTHLQFNPLAG